MQRVLKHPFPTRRSSVLVGSAKCAPITNTPLSAYFSTKPMRVWRPVSLSMSNVASRCGIVHCIGGSEEHTSEPQSLMHSSYPVFCLKKKIYVSHTLLSY